MSDPSAANGVVGEKRPRDDESLTTPTETAAASGASTAASGSTPAAPPTVPKAATASKPRARARTSDAGPAKKKRRSFAPGTPTAWCHQDHQPHDLNEETLLSCTNMKPFGKPKADSTDPLPTKLCTIKYCDKCLAKHYDVDAKAMVASGAADDWICFMCRGECNCTSCRRKLLGETSNEVAALASGGGLFDREPEMIDVAAGGRSAAKAAKERMTAALAVPVKPNAEGDFSKKGKKRAKAADKPRVDADGLSDSSLSDLTDSDEEGAKKSRRKSAGMQKTDSNAGSTVDGPKRVMPPRPPATLAPPPPTRLLSSVYYPHPTLPVDDSILSRMHLREFYLRFLPLMPSIAPPKNGKGPTAQLARVLSSLSDDILWLWTDHDSAAELVQLRLLGGIVELLLRERITTSAIHKLQREKLDDLQNQVKTAVAGIQRHREVYDLPWRTAKEVLTIVKDSRGKEWVGVGLEWEKEAKVRRDALEKAKKRAAAGPEVAPETAVKNGDADAESELSSLSSASSVIEDNETSAPNGNVKSEGSANGAGEDDEVDQLASDYEEPLRPIGSPEKKSRRKKGERETPAEERLALICGLIELSYETELLRGDFARAAEVHYREIVENNKDRIAVKKDLNERKTELTTKKAALEKPPGNNISSKVKEYHDEIEAIDDEIKEAEIAAKKESWRVQHEYIQIAARNRLRFEDIGRDVNGNVYYILTFPPPALLQNASSATTSSFPLDRRPEDDGKRDYPLSFSIVGYGTRPAAAAAPAPSRQGTPVKKEASVEPSSSGTRADAASTPARVAQASSSASPSSDAESKEWFVVHGIDELDALADWVDSSAEHVDWAIRLADFQLEHPKTKQNGKYLPPPDPEVVARLRARIKGMSWDLVSQLRQFADAMKWVRETAALATQGGILPRARAGKGRRST